MSDAMNEAEARRHRLQEIRKRAAAKQGGEAAALVGDNAPSSEEKIEPVPMVEDAGSEGAQPEIEESMESRRKRFKLLRENAKLQKETAQVKWDRGNHGNSNIASPVPGRWKQ